MGAMPPASSVGPPPPATNPDPREVRGAVGFGLDPRHSPMAQRRHSTRRAGARRRYDPDDPDLEGGGGRHAHRGTSPNMTPVVGVVAAVAVIGVLFAVYANQHKQPAQADTGAGAPADTTVDPFASVPDETGPRGMSPGGKRAGPVDRSPVHLLDDPIWVAAATRANEGYELHRQAQAAKQAKDEAAYMSNALAARDLFNRIAEETALWEAEIADRYGENDLRVRQVMRERDKWFDIIQKYKGL